jgi:hypothetical protein
MVVKVLEDYLPDEFKTYPSKSLSSVPAMSGIYFLIQDTPGSSHRYQYVGHAGDLKERLKQHLCEDTGTFTGEKKAVVLRPEKLTSIGYVVTEGKITWPAKIQLPPRNPNDGQEKYDKKCRKLIAESLEILAKNSEVYSPVLNDRGKVSKKARELYDFEPFKQAIQYLLTRDFHSVQLPSAHGLYLENEKLKEKIQSLSKNKM